MFRFILALCYSIAFSSFATDTKVYRWVTEDGRVIFSDQPAPGAKPIDLTAKVQNVTESIKTTPLPVQPEPSLGKSIQLTFLGIEDQATVRNATGQLTVTAYIDIQIGITQKLQLWLDGNVTGKPQSSMQFHLTNIDRGEHTLQLKLINTIGDVLSQSKVITFFMHRPSQKSP